MAVPLISGVNYLLKNDLKIFMRPTKEDLKEEELLGSTEVNNFRVAQIQKALRSFGYDPGAINGKLGKNTRQAIKEFQIAEEISPTGRIDSRTYFELLKNSKIKMKNTQGRASVKREKDDLGIKDDILANIAKENKKIEKPQKAISRLPSKKIEDKNCATKAKNKPKTDIKSIQLTLKKSGLYKGKIDGLVGKRTYLAIKKFQKTHGLAPDGILGYKTKLCLNKVIKR